MKQFEIAHRTEAPAAFTIEHDGQEDAGILTYYIKNDTLLITHVGVVGSLRGTGAARQLVDRAVEYAREFHLEIQSFCSYGSHILNTCY